MPVAPKPFKYVCPKCGFSKVVKPKSDVINPMDLMSQCAKCGGEMERKELNAIDLIMDKLTK